MTPHIGRNPLFYMLLLPVAADLILTLAGQPAAYWQDYRRANEMSPAFFILTTHPLLFAAAGACYVAALYWGLRWLRAPLNLMAACGFLVGHTWGGSSWLESGLLRWSRSLAAAPWASFLAWGGLISYFVLVGICAGAALGVYLRRAGAVPE